MNFRFQEMVSVEGEDVLYLARIDEHSSFVGTPIPNVGGTYRSSIVPTTSIKRTHHGIPAVSESLFNLWFDENIGMGEIGKWEDMLSDNNILPNVRTDYEKFLHFSIKEQYQIINNGY